MGTDSSMGGDQERARGSGGQWDGISILLDLDGTCLPPSGLDPVRRNAMFDVSGSMVFTPYEAEYEPASLGWFAGRLRTVRMV